MRNIFKHDFIKILFVTFLSLGFVIAENSINTVPARASDPYAFHNVTTSTNGTNGQTYTTYLPGLALSSTGMQITTSSNGILISSSSLPIQVNTGGSGNMYLDNALNLMGLYTTTSSSGYMYVATGSSTNPTLSKYYFDGTGAGSGGSPLWQINVQYPYDVAVGNDGNIYISSNNQNIYEYDTNGNLIRSLTSNGYMYNFMINAQGYIWANDGSTYPIRLINYGDTLNCSIPPPASSIFSTNQELSFDKTYMYTIGRLSGSPATGYIWKYNKCSLANTFTMPASVVLNGQLFGVAVSADSTLWATYYTSTVPHYGLIHIDQNNNVLGTYQNPANSSMYSIGFDGSGMMWIEGSGVIYSFNLNTLSYASYTATNLQTNSGSLKTDVYGDVLMHSSTTIGTYICNSAKNPPVQFVTLNGTTDGLGSGDVQVYNNGLNIGYAQNAVAGGYEYSLNSANSVLHFDALGNLVGIWSPSNLKLYSINGIGISGTSITMSSTGGFTLFDNEGSGHSISSGIGSGLVLKAGGNVMTLSSSAFAQSIARNSVIENNYGVYLTAPIATYLSGGTLTMSVNTITLTTQFMTMSTSKFTMTIGNDIPVAMTFSNSSAVVSNGATAKYGGPITGSGLTQPSMTMSMMGITQPTGSFSLDAVPFTNFTANGYTGYDFILDPVLWRGSAGNWINYPLPGWNTTNPNYFNMIYGNGYWLMWDPYNKLQSTFGSPFGGVVEAILLSSANSDYQRYIGSIGSSSFLQEVANSQYFSLQAHGSNNKLILSSASGITLSTNGSGLNIATANSTINSDVNGIDITSGKGTLRLTGDGVANVYLDNPSNTQTLYLGYNTNYTDISNNVTGNQIVNIGSSLNPNSVVNLPNLTYNSGSFPSGWQLSAPLVATTITSNIVNIVNPTLPTATTYGYNAITATVPYTTTAFNAMTQSTYDSNGNLLASTYFTINSQGSNSWNFYMHNPYSGFFTGTLNIGADGGNGFWITEGGGGTLFIGSSSSGLSLIGNPTVLSGANEGLDKVYLDEGTPFSVGTGPSNPSPTGMSITLATNAGLGISGVALDNSLWNVNAVYPRNPTNALQTLTTSTTGFYDHLGVWHPDHKVMDNATLSSGTVTVNLAVGFQSASSFTCSVNELGDSVGTVPSLSVTKVSGIQFTINSSSGSDASVVDYTCVGQ